MVQVETPRSGYEKVAGVPWLARMIDKARLQAQGRLEALDLEYPCPVDCSLLDQMGVDGKTFQEIVVRCQSDETIVEELKSRNLLPDLE